MIESQRHDLERLTTPILQVAEGVLTVPILGSISAERAMVITERLLEAIQHNQARFAIVDITGTEVVDTHTANHLIRLTRTVALLGARCIVTGIQPAVAQTLVALDTDFHNVVTLATLRDGLEYCASAR